MGKIAAFFLIALLFTGSCLAAGVINFPALSGRVVDQAGLLDQNTAQQLTQQLAAHETRTGQQVVVAIVNSLQGQTIEDYGYQLGRNWGIGQKDKDTGVILLVAPKEHKVRIEVGYGLEGTLTDAKSADIIQGVIVPAFKQGQMQQGIVAGMGAILQVLGDPKTSSYSAPAPVQANSFQTTQAAPIGFGFHGIMGLLGLGIFLFGFLVVAISGGLGYGYNRYGYGWGGGWGGSGGGGFSGGGGSFGGGGASGSW